MKPTNAEEFGTPCDITETTVEDAMMRLNERLNDSIGRVYFYAKVSYPALLWSVQSCLKFQVPVMIREDYDSDEWSMVGVLATARSGHSEIVKAEIWSPGA